MAIDIDHRVTKQQYTPLLPFNGIKGGRKTSCMACQQKKKKKKKKNKEQALRLRAIRALGPYLHREELIELARRPHAGEVRTHNDSCFIT